MTRALYCGVFGDAGVGKTTMINRLATGQFQEDYKPTGERKVTPLEYKTNTGPLFIDFYDGLKEQKDSVTKEGPLNCAILMFDLTSRASFNHVIDWYRQIIATYGNIPVVLCGNKADETKRRIKTQELATFLYHHKELGLTYYDVSYKSNYNFEKPLLHLARIVKSNPDLCFTS